MLDQPDMPDSSSSFFKQLPRKLKSDDVKLPLYFGIGLIALFLITSSLAPEISKRLGLISQKKQQQQSFAKEVTSASDPLLAQKFGLKGQTLVDIVKQLKAGDSAGLFVKGQLLVKFKDIAGSKVASRFRSGVTSVSGPLGIASIDALGAKYSVTRITPAFSALHQKAANERKSLRALVDEVNRRFPQRAHRAGAKQSAPNLLNVYRIEFSKSDVNAAVVAAAYARDPNVEYAVPNTFVKALVVPNDPYYSSSGSFGQPYDDLWGLKKIQSDKTWDITTGSSLVTVAVIDTGIDYNHPDIAANIWTNPNEIPGNSIDDDGNGYVDDTGGWDFVTCDLEIVGCSGQKSEDNDPNDPFGHGTHVAGIIDALGNNGIGIVGASWGSTIMPVRVLNQQGAGTFDWVANGITYAAHNGADVINISLGGPVIAEPFLKDAVNYAASMGVVVVAAAGNDFGLDARNVVPAGFRNVITVSASDHNDQRADFANNGAKIDVTAPGGDSIYLSDGSYDGGIGANILSLRAAGTDVYCSVGGPCGVNIVGDTYYRARGTSVAAPYVAGAAALAVAMHPDWTNEMVRHVVRAGADDVMASGWDLDTGFGRLNLFGTLSLQNACSPTITSPEQFSQVGDSATVTGTATCASGTVQWELSWGSGSMPTTFTPVAAGQGSSTQTFSQQVSFSGVPPLSEITLRLTARNDQGEIYTDRIMLLPTLLKPGWNKTWHPDGNALYGSPGFYLLGNNTSALAFGDESNAVSPPASFDLHFASGGTADDQLGWPIDVSIMNPTVSIGELDAQRAGSEIAYHLGSKIRLYDREGNEIVENGWPRSLTSSGFNVCDVSCASPIVDLDNDGVNEVVYVDSTGVYAYRRDGANVFSKDIPLLMWIPPTIAQLDTDVEKEIVVGATNGDILAFNLDGTQVPGTPFHIPNFDPDPKKAFYFIVSAANIDGDERDELLVHFEQGMTNINEVVLFHPDGSIFAGWPKTFPDSDWSANFPSAGDVNGDGNPEIVVAQSDNLYVFNREGSLLPGWPKPLLYPWQTPLLADIDNDKKQEIFVMGTYAVYQVWGFRGDGTPLPSFPFSLPSSPFLYFTHPLIGDIEGNQQLDIVMFGGLGSQMVTLEFPSQTQIKPHLPTFRQNMARTGTMLAEVSDSFDFDGDGFTNGVEKHVGTDPNDNCADNGLDNAWPPDINNDRYVDVTDIGRVAAFFGKIVTGSNRRLDLNVDGFIDITDKGKVAEYFGKTCTP